MMIPILRKFATSVCYRPDIAFQCMHTRWELQCDDIIFFTEKHVVNLFARYQCTTKYGKCAC